MKAEIWRFKILILYLLKELLKPGNNFWGDLIKSSRSLKFSLFGGSAFQKIRDLLGDEVEMLLGYSVQKLKSTYKACRQGIGIQKGGKIHSLSVTLKVSSTTIGLLLKLVVQCCKTKGLFSCLSEHLALLLRELYDLWQSKFNHRPLIWLLDLAHKW